MRRVMMLLIGALTVGTLAVMALPAGAQSQENYVGPSTSVQSTETVPASVAPASTAKVLGQTASRGSLPVTGSDVTGLLVVGTGLVLLGGSALVVRRRLATAHS